VYDRGVLGDDAETNARAVGLKPSGEENGG